MHLAIINQYYWPHGSATSQLITELAEALVARGHHVTVVTAQIAAPQTSTTRLSKSQTSGGPVDGVSSLAPLRETRHGVRICRVPATRLGKGSIAARLADYGTFYAGALARLMTLTPRPDVMMPLTTPPLIAVAAQAAGLLRRIPVVALIQDVYPDIAVALGVIAAGGPIAAAWAAASGASLRACEGVITLSEPMARRLAGYGVPSSRSHVIPNWALSELEASATTEAKGERSRLEYGFGDRFIVMYSGNLGAGHSFETLLGAAAALQGRPDIHFAFVGDGVRRQQVQDAVTARDLKNVTMLPFAPRERLADSLASADLHAVTMADGIEGLLMPSKLYGILAAARPAIFIGPPASVVATTIAAAACGRSVANGETGALVQAIAGLADDPEAAQTLGRAGRRYLDAHLQRAQALDRYEAVLSSVVTSAGRRGSSVSSLSSATRHLATTFGRRRHRHHS